MKKSFAFLTLLLFAAITAHAQIAYEMYFTDQALRVDFFQSGDAKEEIITLDMLNRENLWPGSKSHLIDPFGYGRYQIKLFDVASNTMIFSQGFDCMYGEYRTTTPAIEGVKRAYRRSVRTPFPRKPVLFLLERREKNNLYTPLFTQTIDPADYHINSHNTKATGEVYKSLINGEPSGKVDLLFIAEGYTADQKKKFFADVDRMRDYLFSVDPYKGKKSQFNVRGLFLPSSENGVDEPRQGSYKNTLLHASFNAFDLDRYMLTEEGHLLRRLAAQAPCDALVILVNSKRYGGGGIYNDYAITTVDHEVSNRVFIHEFGHSFAGLADEYYSSEVAYNDFYPKGVEPVEPNITALLDPGYVKWQALLSPGIAVPTEYGKEELENLQKAWRENTQARDQEMEAAEGKDLEEIKSRYEKRKEELESQMKAIHEKYAHLSDKVGVFEGAGYSSKGLYRPMMNCLMGSNKNDLFCRVCQHAIGQMIDYYSK